MYATDRNTQYFQQLFTINKIKLLIFTTLSTVFISHIPPDTFFKMPRKVDYAQVAGIKDDKARVKALLIHVWSSMPGISDRFEAITKENARRFYHQFREEVKDEEDVVDMLAACGERGYPWLYTMADEAGRKWMTGLVFVAIELKVFAEHIKDGATYDEYMASTGMKKKELEKRLKKEREEKVMEVLQREIIDEWVPYFDEVVEQVVSSFALEPKWE